MYNEIKYAPASPMYKKPNKFNNKIIVKTIIEYCNKIINSWWNIPKIKIINHFYNHKSYINCFVKNTKNFNIKNFDHILFSFHGLPERHVDKTYTKAYLRHLFTNNEILAKQIATLHNIRFYLWFYGLRHKQ